MRLKTSPFGPLRAGSRGAAYLPQSALAATPRARPPSCHRQLRPAQPHREKPQDANPRTTRARCSSSEVRSASGIGQATVVLTSPRRPGHLVLRFYLQGLEHLRLAYGETVISASVASWGTNQVREMRLDWIDFYR